MELRVLGDVEVWVEDRRIEMGHARQLCVLAVLAMEVNRVVTADQLLDRVWPDRPPHRGRQVLRTYLSRLRALLAPAEVEIERRPTGYVLLADQDVVDAHRFRRLVAQARAAEDQQAAGLFDQALGLWRGEPFAGLDSHWLAAVRTGLEAERAAARLDHLEVALRCGRHARLIPELSTLAGENPLDERIAGLLMLALYRAGRQADALAHYQLVRRHLAEELGADPGPELRQLHQRVLAADPGLLPAATAPVVTAGPVPRQLPAAPWAFTGRTDQLADLTAALDQGGPVVISALAGTGGIGKTWLALAWAHRHLDRFPDGQLFVDLRGFSPESEPMAPVHALRGFLDGLGLDSARIPVDVQAQTGLFRSLVAGKRMLIVLDNAASAEQVAPLLPGDGSCTVVVTSRRTLTGLITRHGAHHLAIGRLTDDEARGLLIRRLGAARVAAEPEAVAQLLGWCGGFPLALGIIASRAHARPGTGLAELAAELHGPGLGAVTDEDPATSLPAVLSWSYRALTGEQQVMFGLLAIAPGPDISLHAAADLAGLTLVQAAQTLRGLVDAALLSQDEHDRYSMHDLIRRYATENARDELSDEVRATALRQVIDFYRHTAYTADRLLSPQRPAPEFDPPGPGCHVPPLPDAQAALAWFDAEHSCLLAAQRSAAAQGLHSAVWQLAWSLTTFHLRRGHRHDRLAAWLAGLAAAEHLADPSVPPLIHRFVGDAYADLGRHDEALSHLQQSLALAEQNHDHTLQAHTHRMLAWAWGRRADNRRALEHATFALKHYQDLGEPMFEALALNEVAWYAAQTGDYDSAREHCLAALDLFGRHPYPTAEGGAWDTLAYIEHRTGHHSEAVHHHGKAIAMARDLGDVSQVAVSLDGLGHPLAALGRTDEARAAWSEAAELFRAQGRDEEADRVQQQLDELGR